jgi:hypothetical protein
MLEPVYEYPDVLRAGATLYQARALGKLETDGKWGGYLVFVPVEAGRTLTTDRETTQGSLADLDNWARTLSWVYLEGALNRALALQPEVQLSRRLAEIEQEEAAASAEADALARAAESAREHAELAHKERMATEQILAEATQSVGGSKRSSRRKR